MGSIGLGLVAGAACFVACTSLKNAMGYDDSLDVFGIHCIGGIIGALGTGILVASSLGGVGLADYTTKPGEMVAGDYVMVVQLVVQFKAVLLTLFWSGIGSALIFKLVDAVIGLRPAEDREREGLDVTEHGERAYNY